MKKKNKLTINTLAMGNLKQRRKQYTILIIGIILAMVFSSGIMFFYSCMKSSVAENHRVTYGAQEIIFTCADTVDFEKSPVYEYVAECGYAHTIGFAYEDKGNLENGVAVTWLDEKAKDLSYLAFLEGRYPQKQGEIAIEKSVMVRLGIGGKKLGDKVSLDLLIPDTTDFFDKSEKREFTLVGIVSDRKRYLDRITDDSDLCKFIPGVYVHQTEKAALGGKEILMAYCNLTDFEGKDKNDYDLYYKAYEATAKDYKAGSFKDIMVERWTTYSEGTAASEITGNMYYSMVFATVLALVSCLAIVNSFGNNLRERKKQIGLLRAVGATKRQIIRIFAREAFIISVICAPISIFISYFGVKTLTKFFGDNFIFMPKIWVLLLGAGVGVICVMCAALIPLFSASKISPMQAIRNVELSRKMKHRKIKSQKIFNVPKLLSKRNVTFFRARQIIISIILAVTIFCSCLGFSFLIGEYGEINSIWYDYSIYTNSGLFGSFVNYNLNKVGYTENHRAELVSSGYFSEIDGYKRCQASLVVDELTDYMRIRAIGGQIDLYPIIQNGVTKDNYKEKLTASYNEIFLEAQDKYGYDSLLFSMDMNAFDEDAVANIKDGIVEGKINIDKINSGEEIILICPEEIGFYIVSEEYSEYSGEAYTFPEYWNMRYSTDEMKIEILETAERSFKVGDEITVSVVRGEENGDKFVRTDRKVKIGAILNEIPSKGLFSYHFGGDFNLLTTIEGMEHFAPDLDYSYFSLWARDELNDANDKEISSFIEDVSLGVADGRFRSEYAFEQNNREEIKILLAAMISIILLFFTICGSVINNALSARIRDGKKEIGTLRAVGADLKTIVSSYIRQLISMFGWGYGIGFGGYTLTHIVLVLYYGKEVYNIPFIIWPAVIICVLLCIICSANLYIKIRQEMKHSIVENIREL